MSPNKLTPKVYFCRRGDQCGNREQFAEPGICPDCKQPLKVYDRAGEFIENLFGNDDDAFDGVRAALDLFKTIGAYAVGLKIPDDS